MSWKKLLAGRKVKAEATSHEEIDDLRRKVASNLKDAEVEAVSAQGRYEFAYNAARLGATMVVRAAGYRADTKDVKSFERRVEARIAKHHPELARTK